MIHETKEIPIDQIKIPDVRLSSILDEEQRTFLAASLKEVGVINDPVVRVLEDGTYELVAGKSRIQELQKIGVDSVACKVLDVDKKTSLKMNVIENVARGSWDYISMALTIQELLNEGASMDEVCRTFNRSKTWVQRTLLLLELPEEFQQAVREKKLTPTHIQIALQMPTPNEVAALLQSTIVHGWNTSYVRTYVNNRLYEIEAAKKLAEAQGTQPDIPPPQPQKLVNYKQCLCCTYRYPSEQVLLYPVCQHCLKLIQYVTSQVGEPAKAIQIIYEALKAYLAKPTTHDLPPLPPITGDGKD